MTTMSVSAGAAGPENLSWSAGTAGPSVGSFGERGERVARTLRVLNPGEDGVELELLEIALLEFCPLAGRGHGRTLAPSQRVRRDGGLRTVVLAPVDVDLAAA